MRNFLLGAAASIGFACSSSDSETMSTGELALQNAGSHLAGSGHCATIAQIDSACPADLAWDNHGQYVSCVARYLSARVAAGDIGEDEKGALVSVAARSSIGKKKAKDRQQPDFGDCGDADGGVAGAPGSGGDTHQGDDPHGGADHDGGGHGGAAGGDGEAGSGHGGFDAGGDGGCAGRADNHAGAESSWGGQP